MKPQVYFIGAGPGDPELISVKAKKIIEQADVIIYADSLVNPEVCSFARQDAEIHRSASLKLEDIVDIMKDAVMQGKLVARLQSGDPAIYGAIYEQMAALEKNGINYEVIPRVSSLFAAAAALKTEFTVPGLAQTVIITRIEGKTPVPETEKLKELAKHQATLAIFLSIAHIEQVISKLLDGGYPGETPVAVVYKTSWPDEKIVRSTLNDIIPEVKKLGINRQALILVGNVLNPAPRKVKRSAVYGKK
ncbi:precorrin-4 C(11)-methyltransferase [Chloroflexota bacterium]